MRGSAFAAVAATAAVASFSLLRLLANRRRATATPEAGPAPSTPVLPAGDCRPSTPVTTLAGEDCRPSTPETAGESLKAAGEEESSFSPGLSASLPEVEASALPADFRPPVSTPETGEAAGEERLLSPELPTIPLSPAAKPIAASAAAADRLAKPAKPAKRTSAEAPAAAALPPLPPADVEAFMSEVMQRSVLSQPADLAAQAQALAGRAGRAGGKAGKKAPQLSSWAEKFVQAMRLLDENLPRAVAAAKLLLEQALSSAEKPGAPPFASALTMRGVGYVHAVVGELQLAAFAYIKALGLVKLQAGKQQEGKQQARELGVRVRTLLLGCHRDVAVLLHELGRHADAAKQWSNALLLLADLERDLSSASPASSPRPAANASSPKPKPPPAAAAWSAERCELQLGLADALLLGTDDKEAERAAGLTRAVLDARVAQLGERHPASVAAAYELARVHRAVSQRQVRCEAGEQADATRQRGEEARDAAGVLDALWLPSLFHFCEGDRKTLADQLALLGQVAAIHHEQREAAMLFERALRTHARALAPAVKAAGEGWEEGEGWEATLRSSAPVEVADVAVYWADALQAGGELPAAERAVCLAAAVMAREAGHAGSAQLQCAQAELASVQAAAQAQAAAEAAAAADGPAAAAATQASAAAVARADLLFAAALGCSRGAVDALPAPLATSPGAQAVGAAGAQQLQEERGRAAEAHARVLKRLAQHLARKASAAGVGEVRVALLAEERLLREELTELEQEHGISWH